MNNVDIVKKRLKDLRQLSQNLKESSEGNQDLNVNILKVILNITKDVSGRRSSTQQSEAHGGNFGSAAGPMSGTNNYNSNGSMREAEGSNKQPAFRNYPQGLGRSHKKSIDEGSSEQESSSEDEEKQALKQQLAKQKQQIEGLRHKNEMLQAKVTQLQSSQPQQSQFRHLSYFKLSEIVNVFLTRLTLLPSDIGNIEYTPSEASLTLDTLTIQAPLLTSHQSLHSEQDTAVRLDISDMYRVDYFNDNVLMLSFHQDEGGDRFLYMSFDNYEGMHRWDMGFFVNFWIMRSLGGSELFSSHGVFGGDRKKESSPGEKKESEKSEVEEYKSDKFKLRDQQEIREYFDLKQGVELTSDQKMHFSEYIQYKEKYETLDRSIKQIVKLKRIGTTGNKDQSNNDSKQEKQTKSLNREQAVAKSPTMSVNPIDEAQLIRKMKQIEVQRQKTQERPSEQRKKQQLYEAKIILKKGMYATKYAEGALNPHEKRFFISQDEKNFCWQTKGEKTFKSVPIEDIVSINIGDLGPGILKHVDRNKINNIKCFVVLKLKTEGRPQLEFGMKSAENMDYFSEKLQIVMNNIREQKQIKF